MNIEGSNYNVHMQSVVAYCSQLEATLVHKLVYDFYCKVLGSCPLYLLGVMSLCGWSNLQITYNE